VSAPNLFVTRGEGDPTRALAGLVVATLAAALATETVTVSDSVELPAVLFAAAVAAGPTNSRCRWSPRRPRPTPINLAISFLVALGLIVSRATQESGGDATSGLHAVAGVFLIVLAIRGVALTDANRVRSALLMSMGATLAGCATGDVGATLPWALLWLVAAVATLLALVDVSLAALPRLASGDARRSSGVPWARAATVLAAVAVAAAAVVVVDPDPGRAISRTGEPAGGSALGPYDSYNTSLDTAARFTPGDEVVMTVRAPAPDYWRGQTFDVWDGRRWTASRPVRSSFPAAGTGFVAPGIGDVEAGGQTFVQHITVEAPSMQLLFGAYRIDEVDSAIRGLVTHGDGSIELTAPNGPGTEYTVVSLRQAVTAAALRAHDPTPESLPPYIDSLYLQLPDEVPARVTALAHSILDGEPTAYDKVKAIDRWLRADVQYTLDIPRLPDGADAVDQFLFVDRKGFCEQIATASAVLLRSVGVPARIATGYVPGDESLLGGEFTVHASDAHAWVEVWFPDLGWQAFDPTASVPLAGDSSSTPADRLADLLARAAPWLVLLFVVVLVTAVTALVVGLVRRRRALASSPWAHRFALRLEGAGSARGRPRAPSETPAEYASALGASVLTDERLARVGTVVTHAAYGEADLTPDERAWAETVLAEAERASPKRRRFPFSRQ
jgi:transglutaminase-like putative cysteine protease